MEGNTKEYRLAVELASTLNDEKSISWYTAITKRYSETYLRDTLMRVLSIPEEKIKRSRAALFNHLVNSYGRQHPRH